MLNLNFVACLNLNYTGLNTLYCANIDSNIDLDQTMTNVTKKVELLFMKVATRFIN